MGEQRIPLWLPFNSLGTTLHITGEEKRFIREWREKVGGDYGQALVVDSLRKFPKERINYIRQEHSDWFLREECEKVDKKEAIGGIAAFSWYCPLFKVAYWAVYLGKADNQDVMFQKRSGEKIFELSTSKNQLQRIFGEWTKDYIFISTDTIDKLISEDNTVIAQIEYYKIKYDGQFWGA